MTKQIPDRNRIESLRKELGFKDPGIFEKSVYAFNLLSELLRVYPMRTNYLTMPVNGHKI